MGQETDDRDDGAARRGGHVIRFHDVGLTYDSGAAPALSDVNLTIGSGESVALVGPSGSGKTSLLRLMNALLVPTTGTVTVDGLDTGVEANIWDVRRRVGLIFQNPDNQIVSTTVERELAFGMENLGMPQADIARRVEEALERFRLVGLRDRAPHRLSGGEKQRVAIAAVLAMEPACLLLDEPTSLLDGAGRREVWEIVEGLGRDGSRTVVHVTQFPEEIRLSSRVIVLHQGRVAFDGAPRELLAVIPDAGRWGLKRPATADIVRDLKAGGYDVPPDAMTVEDIASAMVEREQRELP